MLLDSYQFFFKASIVSEVSDEALQEFKTCSISSAIWTLISKAGDHLDKESKEAGTLEILKLSFLHRWFRYFESQELSSPQIRMQNRPLTEIAEGPSDEDFKDQAPDTN